MQREHLPQELTDLARMARDVAEQHVAPLVRATEAAHDFSPELRDVLAEAGFLGMVVPEEFGGVTSDVRAEALVVEELARVYPSAATYLTAHWVSAKLLVQAALGGQRDDWLLDALHRAADGQWLGALAATEAEAGSDLASVITRATLDGDTWRLDGTKRFITNGGFADFYAVVARTGDAHSGARGVSLFCVPGGDDGPKAVRFEQKMGLHGSATAELVFDGVRVPADHLVGQENRGFPLLMTGLDAGRVVVAGLSLGIADAGLEHSVRYAGQRKQFGQTIGEFQGIQFMLADMAISVAAARALTYDAADAIVHGRPDASRLASIAKTYASDAAMAVSTDAVQVHGGYGYVNDFPVEMLMRDAKINQIYEGTNQLQRALIARSLLKDSTR